MSELLDPVKLREQMADPPKSKMELLKDILDKGVDEELLKELRALPIDETILKEYKLLDDKDRFARLELLVERLMLRVNRLETENEKRTLEQSSYVLQLANFIKYISPLVTKIYKHFFSDDEES